MLMHSSVVFRKYSECIYESQPVEGGSCEGKCGSEKNIAKFIEVKE